MDSDIYRKNIFRMNNIYVKSLMFFRLNEVIFINYATVALGELRSKLKPIP